MLNSKTALSYIERIEKSRDEAAKYESSILREVRAEPDYESNADKDLLEAVRLRAEARQILDDANAIIGAFDWVYDESTGENVPKEDNPDGK